MTLLEQWAIVLEAYREANFRKFAKRTLTEPESRPYAIVSFTSFLFLIIYSLNMRFCFLKTPLFIDLPALLFLILVIYFSFGKAIKEVFKENGNISSNLLKYYRKDLEYARYLLFKENLEDKKDEIDFEQISEFVEKDLEMAKVSIFKERPFSVTLIGIIITAILTGWASRKEDWAKDITIFIFIVALLLLYFGIQFVEIFKTREYKLYELKKFIFWLEQEKRKKGGK